MTNSARLPLSTAFAVLAVALAAAGWVRPLPPGSAPLLWIALLWLPGTLLVSDAEWTAMRGRRSADALWTAWVLGPVVFGAAAVLGRLAGLPLQAGAVLVVAFAALRLAARSARPVGAEAPSRPSRASWILFGLGAAIVLFAAWPSVVQEALRLRDDARLHLPIAQRILAGEMPPGNPFLAGEPLPYFWFHEAVLAGIASFTSLRLDVIASALNVHGLIGLLAVLAATGRRLGLRPTARAATLVLVAFGFAPYGWIRLLVMQTTHPDFNWALFRAGGVSSLFPVLNPADPRLGAMLTKVAIVNALPMSLALFAYAALPPVAASRLDPARRAVATAGTLLVHLVTGVLLLGGLLLGDAWDLLRGGLRAKATWRRMLWLAIAAIAVAPYAASVLAARAGSGALTLRWQPGHALSLDFTLVGVAALALPVAFRWLRDEATRFRLLVAIPSLVLPFVVHLVDGNEYKSVFLLLVLLAPMAGAGTAALARGRAWGTALLLVVFLPTSFLEMREYAREVPPGTLAPADARALEEASRVLPPDAVLWRIEPGRAYSGRGVHMGRTAYLSDPYALQILGAWDSPEALRRRAELAEAQRGSLGGALLIAAERVAPRPLFLTASPADRSRYPRLDRLVASGRFRPVVSTNSLEILALPPPPGSPPGPEP